MKRIDQTLYFPFDVWDGLWVPIWTVPEVSLLQFNFHKVKQKNKLRQVPDFSSCTQ